VILYAVPFATFLLISSADGAVLGACFALAAATIRAVMVASESPLFTAMVAVPSEPVTEN